MEQAEEWNEKGKAYVQEKKYEEALSCYSKAIELNPKEQKYYANRSLMHCNLNDFANAKKDAEKAIELNPNVAKSYLRLGKACFGQLDYIGAYSAYMAGLEIEPQNNNLIEAKNVLIDQVSKMGGQDPKIIESQFENHRQENLKKENQIINETEMELNKNYSDQINIGPNDDKNNKKNLIEKYCLNKRVELKFVKQISEYRFEGKIMEISGGFIFFKREDKYNNTDENHIINLNNVIDIHIL